MHRFMIKWELTTYSWLNLELVTSPSYGIVKEVLIAEGQKISEWAPMFEIENSNGLLQYISVGTRGTIEKVNVKYGSTVFPGTLLAQVKED
jgi:biotin carboxyl carrier protein